VRHGPKGIVGQSERPAGNVTAQRLAEVAHGPQICLARVRKVLNVASDVGHGAAA
jgi:hypothetical protein